MKSKKHLYFLMFTDSFFNISTLILAPVYAVYVLHLGGDVRHIGELYAVFAASFGIIGLIVSRRFLHKRKLIGIAYVLWTIYSFILIFNISLTVFYLLQVIAGAANAVRKPFFSKNMSDHSESDMTSFYAMLYLFLGRMTGAIVSLLAGHIAHHHGYIPVFIAMTCLGFLSSICAFYYSYFHKKMEQIA